MDLSECYYQSDCDSVNERFLSKCDRYGCNRGGGEEERVGATTGGQSGGGGGGGGRAGDSPLFQCDPKSHK